MRKPNLPATHLNLIPQQDDTLTDILRDKILGWHRDLNPRPSFCVLNHFAPIGSYQLVPWGTEQWLKKHYFSLPELTFVF